MLTLDMIDQAAHDRQWHDKLMRSRNCSRSAAYNDGYVVHTTVDGKLQQAARDSVIDGLITYDNRHGWRGPEQRHPPLEDEQPETLTPRWERALRAMPVVADLLPCDRDSHRL